MACCFIFLLSGCVQQTRSRVSASLDGHKGISKCPCLLVSASDQGQRGKTTHCPRCIPSTYDVGVCSFKFRRNTWRTPRGLTKRQLYTTDQIPAVSTARAAEERTKRGKTQMHSMSCASQPYTYLFIVKMACKCTITTPASRVRKAVVYPM